MFRDTDNIPQIHVMDLNNEMMSFLESNIKTMSWEISGKSGWYPSIPKSTDYMLISFQVSFI